MIFLAARFAHLPRWVQLSLAVVLGAAGALSHAPFDFAPAIVIPLAAGFVLLRAATSVRLALFNGWALGTGYFALTYTWLVSPFQVDAATTGWMAPFAVVLLSLFMASYWALAFTVSRWVGGSALALVITWSGGEMLRAYAFTGFAWASPPQALVDAWAGQGLAWLGPYGMICAMLGVVAAMLSVRKERFGYVGLAAVALTLLYAPVYDESPLTAHTIRMIQPNAPQDEKWNPDMIPVFVNRQIDYTAAPGNPDLILWPETALPYLAETAQPVFDVIAEAARGAPVVLGIQRREDTSYYNSLVVLDETGQVSQTYDKHHLVPFGEFMPAAALFKRINIGGLAQRAEGGGYAAGPGPRLLDFGGIGTALPLICYEAGFAHDVGNAPSRPAFLMQLTNDAWFGERSGPQQHLAQARMRAIEQGLPMVRAANTGISAMIDPKGRVVASLGLNTAGYLDAPLPAPGPVTLYARSGDIPWALLLMAGTVALVLRRAAKRRTGTIDAR